MCSAAHRRARVQDRLLHRGLAADTIDDADGDEAVGGEGTCMGSSK